MNKFTKKKIRALMLRIASVEKNMNRIIRECVVENNETLLFWTGKEKELKEQYAILKAVYSIIVKYIIEHEYWAKAKEQVERINRLKSINIMVDADYKKKRIHIRTINNLYQTAYNAFAVAIDTGFKKKMRLFSEIQQATIKVNRLEDDTD